MQTNNKPNLIHRLLSFIHTIEDILLATLLIAMLLLASAQIVLRNFLDIGIVWADPLLRIMVLWIGLLGALAASKTNKHITVDVLTRLMNSGARRLTRIFTSLFTACVAGIIAYHAARFVAFEYEAKTMVIGLPAWVFTLIIPIAFGFITLRYLLHFSQHLRHKEPEANAK
jgi:TRAP-type C4-dicarboxylate transport system permease small subunit